MVVLQMFCHIKMLHQTIRTLVITGKIFLILIILKYRDMIKEGLEEMDSS